MTFKDVAQRLADVVAVPVVPFGTDGEIDFDAYGRVLERIVDGGVRTITCNGNTGEFYALTAAEVDRIVSATVGRVGDRGLVVAGVGHDVATAVEMARVAAAAGAKAVMVHQPVNPYVAEAGWLEYHRAIADAVPELGVVLYVRNPATSASQIARLAELCENLVGIKYAVSDQVAFAAVMRDCGYAERLVWIAGQAELAAPGYFAYGASGFTSGLVNVEPALAVRMMTALRAGDFAEAMKVWELVRPFERLRVANGSAHNVSVVKCALGLLGICRPDVRPPSAVPGDDIRAAIRTTLTSWGFTGFVD